MVEHVRRHGSARIDDLAARFDVSPWTVRRDLAQLEETGLLRRTRGGALVVTPAGSAAGWVDDDAGPRVDAPESPGQAAAKERIAQHAAQLVADDSTVLILAGSTTGAMLPHLVQRRLTVVTNGLDIAHGLRHAPHVSVLVLGGMLHRAQMTLLGPLTEAAMAQLHVDRIVAGAYGIDPAVGVTGTKIAQAGHHRGMLTHTDGLIVLADATKLGRRGPTLLAGIDEVDTVVTDAAADSAVVAGLRARDVAVDIV